ncbi:pol [Symbiodinium sp. CCMP2592]|nr:pol [Symbiodinium sp. CCMP2592]
MEIVDEDDLIELAKSHTKPRTSQKYQDSPEIKEAIIAAKVSKLPADWKRVHRLRKQHRRLWAGSRLSRILAGDWDLYRQLQNEKKRRRGWWGNLLAEQGSEDLAARISLHLKEKMCSSDRSADVWEAELLAYIQNSHEDDVFMPFTLLDVRTELQGMKCRSAVGPDGIGVHLLREIASDDTLGPRLLGLINHIVQSRELPHSWETCFLALLAKVKLPTGPADLRPICVSSAFHKLVNRLVCSRALPLMRQGSSVSCCGKGRQAADLIGAISRLRDITKEWAHPLIVCKLDVAGAFDKVERSKVAELLCRRLRHKGVSTELRYLLAQLAVHHLVGNAPGGKQVCLSPDNGIKQGAPESAELFGLVVDSLLSELVSCRRWGDLGQPIAELGVDLLFYQDDVFIIETEFGRLCKRINIVDRCLQQAGLTLAKGKTKIVANCHYAGPRCARVGDNTFRISDEGDSLKVLGLSFSLSRDASEQARELIARARDAAAAHKDILRAPGAWLKKVKMMSTLIEAQFSWTAGALHWSKDDLHALNVLQLHTCRSAFGLRRTAGESWADWNQRSLRFVRLWLVSNDVRRWSEKVLTLQHTLHGTPLGGVDSSSLVGHVLFVIRISSTLPMLNDSSPKVVVLYGMS